MNASVNVSLFYFRLDPCHGQCKSTPDDRFTVASVSDRLRKARECIVCWSNMQ